MRGSDGTIRAEIKKLHVPSKLPSKLFSKTKAKEDNGFVDIVPYAALGYYNGDEDLMV